jgi:hypothetical protein
MLPQTGLFGTKLTNVGINRRAGAVIPARNPRRREMRGTSILLVAVAGGALALAGAAQAQLIEHGVAGTQAGGGQLNGAVNAPLTPGNPDTQTTTGTATRIPAHKHADAKGDPAKGASSASGSGADTSASTGGSASTSGASGSAGASGDAGAKSTTGGQSDTAGSKSDTGPGGPH